MKINIDIDVSDCKLNVEDMLKAVDNELQKTAYKIERTSKSLVPVDSGDLKRSIETHKITKLEYEIGTNVEYAHFIEDGTTPHIIQGNPILHWSRDGQEHFAYSVYHTGNKAYLYMETAMLTHVSDLEQRIANAIKL